MKIGINGFEAVVPRFGYDEKGLPKRVGSSEFCYQLLVNIEKFDDKNEYRIYLPTNPTSDLPKERPNWKYIVVPGKKLWTLFGLSKKLTAADLDIFFSPTHYAPFALRVPQVISILDVSYKHFPEMFPKKDLLKLAVWGKYSIRNAKRIITISNSSKNDIIKEYRINPNKVNVVSVGIKEVMQSSISSKDFIDKYNLSNPFILFVGTIQPRKNIVKLIEALSLMKNKNLDLVVVGRKGWDYEQTINAPKKFGIEDRVKFFDNVSNEDLPLFYKKAEVFVLPSLYEGFGLPVLEAMQYGCPVVTSDTSSLPEAGGNAALYFDPKNAADIADKIEKVLASEKIKKEMIEKGYKQVKKFSWEKSAKEVIQVFEDIGKND